MVFSASALVMASCMVSCEVFLLKLCTGFCA